MIKKVITGDYNYVMDTNNGFFVRWGQNGDPSWSPLGPEILDMEISTICNGPGVPCDFCYKANGPEGTYMTFELFKEIFDRLPKNISQIAFGIGDIDGNPDLYKIMKYCRENDVVPNITINGYRMEESDYQQLSELCGAVSVSNYGKDVCYDAVKKLTDLGMPQINIHQILHDDTLEQCRSLLEDVTIDGRLDKLNAVVFLTKKPKGRACDSKKSTMAVMNFIKEALASKKPIGFDSCSAPMVFKSIDKNNRYLKSLIEPCESFLFSAYCDVKGHFYPCSFCEGVGEWKDGLAFTRDKDFMKDIWNNPLSEAWRLRLLTSSGLCVCDHNDCCRACPIHDITICKG